MISDAGIRIVHPLGKLPFADWKKLLADRRWLTSLGISRWASMSENDPGCVKRR